MAIIFENAKNHPLVANVMIVDDQLTSRIILEKVIQSIGDNIKVRSFDNALSALQVAEETPPDLIIADYKMPELDGVEFIRRLRQIPACFDIPIVVITIVEDKAVMYEALEVGATDFLTKPVDHYECKVRCRNLLTMRRQQLIIRNRANSLEHRIQNAVEEVKARERETLARLARAGEFKDHQTGRHQGRIGHISQLIANDLGLGVRICELIEYAAQLHDIGKLGIPDAILLKTEALLPDEMQIMQTHTQLGFELLRDSPSPYLQMGAIIALNHHEAFAGGGYPAGLRGDEIPLEARITAVADVYDSLVSSRPYKTAWPREKALQEILRLRGTQLDPECVDALLKHSNSLYNGHGTSKANGS